MMNGSVVAKTRGGLVPPAARAAWRFLRDDRLFIGFFAIYTALAFFLLALGLLATLARSSGPPHDLVASLAPGSGSIGRLARIALTAPGYPEGAGEVVLDYALSAVDLALGVFLFWLRPRDWTARLLALA